MKPSTLNVAPRPFLKWVGGKSQLMPLLLARIPKFSGRYFEPFVGAGALLFALQPKRAFISDVNAELVNCYVTIKSDVERLIADLKRHRYQREYFYRVRDLDRTISYQRWSPVRRASRLIFLNKTCFNGLYRVNARGQFNVPFGRYANPRILDADNLRACHRALKSVAIQVAHFLEVESRAKRGDFIYFDPPYVPLSNTSSFTGYSAQGFGLEMQRALRDLCKRLDRRGIKFMLSNSSSPIVLELYKGFRIERVGATRALNSKADRRGQVQEVLVRNY